jgi:hypothetical protein
MLAWLCMHCTATPRPCSGAHTLCCGRAHGCWNVKPASMRTGPVKGTARPLHTLQTHRGCIRSLADHMLSNLASASQLSAGSPWLPVGCHASYRAAEFRWPQAGQRTPAASGAARRIQAAAQQLQQTPLECACASEPPPGCFRLCTAGTWVAGEGLHSHWPTQTGRAGCMLQHCLHDGLLLQ